MAYCLTTTWLLTKLFSRIARRPWFPVMAKAAIRFG
jgi:hypothetical protein